MMVLGGGRGLESRDMALLAATVARDRKADDVAVLDMRDVTLVADYFVICGARTGVQVRAVCDHVVDALKERGVRVHHVEGYEGSTWILLDYGPVVVHVFRDEERRFYALERLWADAKRVEESGGGPPLTGGAG